MAPTELAHAVAQVGQGDRWDHPARMVRAWRKIGIRPERPPKRRSLNRDRRSGPEAKGAATEIEMLRERSAAVGNALGLNSFQRKRPRRGPEEAAPVRGATLKHKRRARPWRAFSAPPPPECAGGVGAATARAAGSSLGPRKRALAHLDKRRRRYSAHPERLTGSDRAR